MIKEVCKTFVYLFPAYSDQFLYTYQCLRDTSFEMRWLASGRPYSLK